MMARGVPRVHLAAPGTVPEHANLKSECVMIVMRRLWPVRAWGVALLTCGMLSLLPGSLFGQDDPVVLEPDRDEVRRVTIMLDSDAFTPGYLRVRAGAPVEFLLENRSFVTPHHFIIDGPVPDLQHSVNVGAGEQVTLRLLPEAPGIYRFSCDKQLLCFPSHRAQGMEGRLDVR